MNQPEGSASVSPQPMLLASSDFLALYSFERPPAAKPVDEFLDELRALIREHAVGPELAEALKYGRVDREAMRRWIKEYYQFIRLDAQGSAAMIARCPRRGLFLALSPIVNRKTGFYQVGAPPREQFIRFAEAFGISFAELEQHYPCPETLQAKYARLQFQFDTFESGFAATVLGAEGVLLDVVRDERPWLCQRGIAEYMKRAFGLSDESVAYWRAYEDFRSFVCEPVWQIAAEVARDASEQQRLRVALHHWLLLYGNMRRAWAQMIRGDYSFPEIAWPPVDRRFQAGAEQTHEEMVEELGEFCLTLPQPQETAFGLLLSGKASLAAAKELIKDFIHMDATRNIAGQFSRIAHGKALRAISQAFATESGGYLTRNHMEIWADFAERACGISRKELFEWVPPTETIGSGYVTKWFLVHCPPEEAIAAFHLGPPPEAKSKLGKRALGIGQGGAAGEGLLEARPGKHPLTLALERLGLDADLADYFFRLHREIEPFEQEEGWEYVPEVVHTHEQRQRFKRAYIEKILAESRKDEALLRRMKLLSGLAA